MSPTEARMRQRFEHTIAMAAVNFGVQGFSALSGYSFIGPVFCLGYACLVWHYTRTVRNTAA